MSWRTTSAIVITVAVAAILAYDAVAYYVAGQPSTISAVLRIHPIVPFLGGLLVGHLWFRGDPPKAFRWFHNNSTD